MTRWTDLDVSDASDRRKFVWTGEPEAAVVALRGAVTALLERWRPVTLQVESGHFDNLEDPVIDRFSRVPAGTTLPADALEVAYDVPIALRVGVPEGADLRPTVTLENPDGRSATATVASAPPLGGVDSRWLVTDAILPHGFRARRTSPNVTEIEWTPGLFTYDRHDCMIAGKPITAWAATDAVIDNWITGQLVDLGFIEVHP